MPGDGKASRQSLQRAIALGPVTYQLVTYDRFGRSVVTAWASRVNLSCYQLKARQAVYKRLWDNGGLVAAACRQFAAAH